MPNRQSILEKVLLTNLKNGEEKAFITIYKEYSEILWSFLLKYKLEQQDAEDIVQQTFAKLWERRAQIDLDQNIKSYLITIAKNDIYNKIKHQIVQKKHKDYALNFQQIETQTDNNELTEILYRILEKIPEKRRKVYEMSRIEGYSNKEISEILNISNSTVENHINNSSSYIKKMLKNLGFIFTMGL